MPEIFKKRIDMLLALVSGVSAGVATFHLSGDLLASISVGSSVSGGIGALVSW